MTCTPKVFCLTFGVHVKASGFLLSSPSSIGLGRYQNQEYCSEKTERPEWKPNRRRRASGE
nr:MAG TPA: hypothetical protein [Caudoviricetes sp.]